MRGLKIEEAVREKVQAKETNLSVGMNLPDVI